jgi:beta-lactamase class A
MTTSEHEFSDPATRDRGGTEIRDFGGAARHTRDGAAVRDHRATAWRDFIGALPADGVFSVWYGPTGGDPWLAHAAERQHYAASTMKLALAVAAYRAADRGDLDLDEQVVVHDDFSSAVGASTFRMDRDDDSDAEPWRRLGEKVSLRWLGLRAIVRSSNLATNLLLEAVGLDEVQDTLSALGARDSVVSRGIEDSYAREQGRQNLVSARDLATTLQALVQHTACSPAACREILDVLAAQQLRDTIPAGLPPGIRVAHKSGWVTGISHDAGIVYPPDAEPFVLVICTTADLTEEAGRTLIAAGAAAAWADHEARR